MADYPTAIDLYRPLVEKGHISGITSLAYALFNSAPEGNMEEIHELYQLAIKGEYAMAMNNYGWMHLFKRIADPDQQYGLELLERAATRGNQMAARNLYLYYSGSEDLREPDPDKAAYWRQRIQELKKPVVPSPQMN